MSTTIVQTSPSLDNASGDPLVIAIAYLDQRMESLPPADRLDLLELFQELGKPYDLEEKRRIYLAMQEILAQPRLVSKEIDLTSTHADRDPELQRWMDFVGPRIRHFREQAGLTQCELSQKSGLPQSHISRIETGKHSPSHFTLEKIALALGCQLSDLYPSDGAQKLAE